MDQYAFRAPGQLTASSPEYIPQSYSNTASAQHHGTNAFFERTSGYGSAPALTQTQAQTHTQGNMYYSRSSSVYSNTDLDSGMSYSQYSGNSSPHSSPPHSPRNDSFIGSNPFASATHVDQRFHGSSSSFRSNAAPFVPHKGGAGVYGNSSSVSASFPNAFETPAPYRSRPPPSSLFHFGNIFLDWKL